MSLKGFITFLIPVIYIMAVIIVQNTGTPLRFGLGLTLLGLFFTFPGLILWFMSFLKLGAKSFAILPKAKVLETKGIYKYFRHPLYLGITLTFLGLSLSKGSWECLFYTIFIIIPLNIVRAKREEKVLSQKFGKEYLDYKKNTW